MKFSGRHFPKYVILQAVRWYVSYSLSLRMIEEMVAERGIALDHMTINCWVISYASKLSSLHQKQKPTGQPHGAWMKLTHDLPEQIFEQYRRARSPVCETIDPPDDAVQGLLFCLGNLPGH